MIEENLDNDDNRLELTISKDFSRGKDVNHESVDVLLEEEELIK